MITYYATIKKEKKLEKSEIVKIQKPTPISNSINDYNGLFMTVVREVLYSLEEGQELVKVELIKKEF